MTISPFDLSRVKVPDSSDISAIDKLKADDYELPLSYPQDLAEAVAIYRLDDHLPSTSFEKLMARPNGQFRMIPLACLRAISYASKYASLIWLALLHQHEEKKARANGLLYGGVDYLMKATSIGRRNHVSDALVELEVRGLIRVLRGRAGAGRNFPNYICLTCYPDALGNRATCDYERMGLPKDRVKSNDRETQEFERQQIDALFNARIAREIAITKFVRRADRMKQTR